MSIVNVKKYLHIILPLLIFALVGPTPAKATNWNPSYPRIGFQYPSPDSHITGCKDFYSRFDLVAISFGNASGCSGEMKAKNAGTIILTGTGNMMSDNENFEYHTFRYFDPRLDQSISTGASTIKVSNTNGEGFPKWETSPGSGNYPYGKYGAVGFIVNDKSSGMANGTPDRFSYSDVDETNKTLLGVIGVDAGHNLSSYIRQAIKIFGWVANITPANPYDGQAAARYFIDQGRLGQVNSSNFQYFDGGYYDAFRTDYDQYTEGSAEQSLANSVDFDMNWQKDWDEHGLNWINDQWHQGLNYMWSYERQRTNQIKNGAKTIVIANNGAAFPDDSTISWNDGFQLEYGVIGQWSWKNYFDKLRLWDRSDKYVLVVDGSLKAVSEMDEERYKHWKNKFSEMRYGLTTALMGNAFYGRNFGQWFYIGYWYDEYETNLGYPTGAPQKIVNHCWRDENNNELCPYIRFFDQGAAIVNATFKPITVTDSDIKNLSSYAGPYYRFVGGQDPNFNNGQQLTDINSINLTGEYNSSKTDKQNRGDGVLLFKVSNYKVASGIMVGNYPNNDTSPASEPVEIFGSWQVEPIKENNPYWTQWNQGDPDKSSWTYSGASYEGYGQFYTTDSNATAIFRPTIGVAGDYEVFEWHGWRGASGVDDEANNVPYQIVIGGNVAKSGNFSQRANFGEWNSLGAYNFPKGTNSYVKLSASGANGAVIADVIKLVYKDGETPPTPTTVPLEGDLDKDGDVDIFDYNLLVENFGSTSCGNEADIDGDCDVDIFDYNLLVGNFGRGR